MLQAGRSRPSGPGAPTSRKLRGDPRRRDLHRRHAHHPLESASTHVTPDPTRTRKLLLHAEEIAKLIGKVERAGYALVPLDLHYTRGRIKISVGLAKGKKQFDKRETEKERDWERERPA